jgi:phosphinothricin acetyltransferase
VTARIRLAQALDAEAIAAIYRPYVDDTVISFEAVAPDQEEMARRIIETLPLYPWLVSEFEDHVTGYAYAARHRVRDAYRWSVDVSVYISQSYHRRGVGRALYTSLFAILAAQGFVNAYAGVTLPNPASVGLHEALGFTKVGVYERVGFKFGAWHDVGWWQSPLRPRDSSPSEPLDMAAVRARPDWNNLLARGESKLRGVQ